MMNSFTNFNHKDFLTSVNFVLQSQQFFFQAFHIEELSYRYGSDECDNVNDVSN